MKDTVDCTATTIENIAVLRVTGCIDLLTAPELREHIERLLSQRPRAVVVDLSELDFLASAGFRILIEIRSAVGEAFAVVADGPATSRPLQLTQLDEVLNLHPTLDAALAALRQR